MSEAHLQLEGISQVWGWQCIHLPHAILVKPLQPTQHCQERQETRRL